MSEIKQLPKFKNEAEEAQWWFDTRDQRDEEFANAIREGRAGKSTLAERVALSQLLIHLDPDDAAEARALAERRGLEYKTYVKQIFHEALQRERELVA